MLCIINNVFMSAIHLVWSCWRVQLGSVSGDEELLSKTTKDNRSYFTIFVTSRSLGNRQSSLIKLYSSASWWDHQVKQIAAEKIACCFAGRRNSSYFYGTYSLSTKLVNDLSRLVKAHLNSDFTKLSSKSSRKRPLPKETLTVTTFLNHRLVFPLSLSSRKRLLRWDLNRSIIELVERV